MSEQPNFTHLNAAQLIDKLSEDQLTIVDIRDANAFAQGRIAGAIHLTNDNMGDFLREADFDKPTVVCCYHGISSQSAAAYLVSLDFSDVYSLEGGFVQWQSLYPEKIER